MRDVIMEKNELDKLHHVLVEILDYFVTWQYVRSTAREGDRILRL